MFCLCLAPLLREDVDRHDKKNSSNAQVIEYLTDIIKKATFRIYRLSAQSLVSCRMFHCPVCRLKVQFRRWRIRHHRRCKSHE